MNITIAWNVWNNYLDVALGSEIVRLENNSKKLFEKVSLISQGGYSEFPSAKERAYLDGHFFVEHPVVPLLDLHPKYTGVFRVIEGIQKSFYYAKEQNSDYLIITNADAWVTSIEKLYMLLQKAEIKEAAISARIGLTVALESNFGNCIPCFDDHFIIVNIKECLKCNVFDYDHSARFFSPHFGHFGGIHNILCCFVDQRVPKGKFYIYSYCEDTIGQYGDYVGWNLLPWQYQLSTGFLHTNCQQFPSLHNLRAAFLHNLGLTKYPYIREYYKNVAPSKKQFTYKNEVLVYRKPLKKKLVSYIWGINKAYHTFLRRKYAQKYRRCGTRYEDTPLYYFDIYKNVMPAKYGV